MNNQKKAYIYALTAVLFWSTAASAFNITLRYVGVLQLLLFSSCTSLSVLFVVLLVQKKSSLLGMCTVQDYARSFVLGLLNPFLYYLVLFKAYSLLSAQQAMTLNYTWPLMLVLLSIPLLNQNITLRSVLAVLISFSGVVIIATRGDFTHLHFISLTGVLLALGSSMIWGLFWILNIRDKRDDVVKLFLNFAFGTTMILLVSLLFSDGWVTVHQGILGTVYIGLFEMGITFVLWLKALSLSGTTAQVGNLVYLSPFLSLLFIRMVVGESIALSTIAGLVLIIAGILLQKKTAIKCKG